MIYIHIPFCRSFCTYCGFYSEIKRGACADHFCKALILEIDRRKCEIPAGLDTLYIGGGTPSVLPLSVLSDIVEAVRKASGRKNFEEFTIEVNPDDITREYAEGLVALGVNRVSMGVQSFDDGVLRWMNRRHDAAGAVRAFKLLREAGVGNISIDLIFGLPQLCGNNIWKDTLHTAIGLRPEHISAYQLSVEQDSALEKLVEDGKFVEAGDEECRSQYEYLRSALSDAGYQQYEVSNFALEGYRAVHNSGYWRHIPYIGFGPAAHSFLNKDGHWVRSWNEPDLNVYLEGGSSGCEILSDSQLELENIMLGLRTREGARVPSCASRDRLVSEGLLEKVPETGCYRITGSGLFISEAIIRELIL